MTNSTYAVSMIQRLDDTIPELVIDADTIMDVLAHLVEDMVRLSEQLGDGEITDEENEEWEGSPELWS